MSKPTSKLTSATLEKIAVFLKDGARERSEQLRKDDPIIYVVVDDDEPIPMRYNKAVEKYGNLYVW